MSKQLCEGDALIEHPDEVMRIEPDRFSSLHQSLDGLVNRHFVGFVQAGQKNV
jgi:hypothetical protein